MPDEPLKLDLDLEHRLKSYMQDDIAAGRFQLTHDKIFVLDPPGDPGRSDLARQLREKFSFIDFDAGGLKLVELQMRGATARFTLVPRWELPSGGKKGLGGASIGLRFTVTW